MTSFFRSRSRWFRRSAAPLPAAHLVTLRADGDASVPSSYPSSPSKHPSTPAFPLTPVRPDGSRSLVSPRSRSSPGRSKKERMSSSPTRRTLRGDGDRNEVESLPSERRPSASGGPFPSGLGRRSFRCNHSRIHCAWALRPKCDRGTDSAFDQAVGPAQLITETPFLRVINSSKNASIRFRSALPISEATQSPRRRRRCGRAGSRVGLKGIQDVIFSIVPVYPPPLTVGSLITRHSDVCTPTPSRLRPCRDPPRTVLGSAAGFQ